MKSIRTLVLFLLLLLLVASVWAVRLPAPFGAGLLPGLAVVAWAACLCFRALPARLWASGGVLLGLIALYAWNPTHLWKEGIGLLPVGHIGWLPGSAFPSGTWETLRLAAALSAGFALAYQLPERQVCWLQIAMTLGAIAMALLVLAQRLEPGRSSVFEYTGIFVNENHFGAFSNLLLPVVLAAAARVHFRSVQRGESSSPAGLFLLAAGLMGAAVFLSRSRAGVAVMALVVLAFVGLYRGWRRQYPFLGAPVPLTLKSAGAVALVVLLAFAVAVVAREWNHLGDLQREWTYRGAILRDALGVWRAHPVWGTGPGTFATVFPYYQSELFQNRTILHAHCEPVQFLAEFGWAGGLGVVLAAGLAVSAKRTALARLDLMPTLAELEGRAFALGLLACAGHSLIDFPFRVPLIALVAAVWAGVWAGHRKRTSAPEGAQIP